MKKLFRFSLLLLFFMVACLGVVAHAEDAINYPPLVQDVSLDSTNLAIVFIEVNGDTIKKDDKITGRMKIIFNSNGQWNYSDTVAHPNQTIDYDGYISIEYRG